MTAPDRLIQLLVRAYFSKTSFALHILIYPILMAAEGGDFHLFLDGISIEAVFVGLMVGISTRQVLDHHHDLRRIAQRILRHHEP